MNIARVVASSKQFLLLLTPQALGHLRNVQVINFGDCLVRCEGAIALAAVLRDGLPILKVRSRESSGLSPYLSALSSTILLQQSVLLPCLQELNLSFGEIAEAAALVVAKAVMDKPYMEKLDLNGTQ